MYRRKNSLRLKGFDYKKEGTYFVTISCREKKSFFENKLLRQILVTNIENLKSRFSIDVNVYMVMPDHLHLLVTLPENNSFGLSKIIQIFKSLVTYDFRLKGNKNRIWQRGFYEHVIRNERDFLEKMNYILNNPLALEIKKREEKDGRIKNPPLRGLEKAGGDELRPYADGWRIA